MTEEKQKFLEELGRGRGSITEACNRCKIRSRQTFYNWKKEDQKFKAQSERIIMEQKEEMNDFVESKLYSLIDQENITAIIFYLKTRHPDYKNYQVWQEKQKYFEKREMTEEEKQLLKEALKHAGLKG